MDIYMADFFRAVVTNEDSGSVKAQELDRGKFFQSHYMSIHGDFNRDGQRVWDIEFMTVLAACTFQRTWSDFIRSFDIRTGDSVTSLSDTVVCEVVVV